MWDQGLELGTRDLGSGFYFLTGTLDCCVGHFAFAFLRLDNEGNSDLK